MVSEQRSRAWLRKRKMLVVLPLLITPFLTMGFWAIKGQTGNVQRGSKTQGLNLNLPGPGLHGEPLRDKLSFYDKAARDSLRLAEEMQTDPAFQKKPEDLFPSSQLSLIAQQTASKYNQSLNASPYSSLQRGPEEEIMKKLAMVEGQISNFKTVKNDTGGLEINAGNDPSLAGKMDRLENMMHSMNSSDAADPEINKMDSVLEKILDIQHPERVKDRMRGNSLKNNAEVFPVEKHPLSPGIGLLDTVTRPGSENSFFGMGDDHISDDQNAIEAVVHGSQTLVNGAVIKLRLLNDVYIAGNFIPRESFVYGICALNGERLEIEIRSVKYKSSIFPVRLQVYDMDGLPGIYIPGAMTRDAAKQSVDNSLDLLQLNALDPSIKAQATTTGINAIKNLLSKKAKLVKVTVKTGYKVLLRQDDVLN